MTLTGCPSWGPVAVMAKLEDTANVIIHIVLRIFRVALLVVALRKPNNIVYGCVSSTRHNVDLALFAYELRELGFFVFLF